MAIVIGGDEYPSVSEVRKYVDKRLQEFSENSNRGFFTHARYYVCTEGERTNEFTVYPFLCWGKPFPDFVTYSGLYTGIKSAIGIDRGYSDCSAREYVPGFYVPTHSFNGTDLFNASLHIYIMDGIEPVIDETIDLFSAWHSAVAEGDLVPVIGVPSAVFEHSSTLSTTHITLYNGADSYDLLNTGVPDGGRYEAGLSSTVDSFDLVNSIAYRRGSIVRNLSNQMLALKLEDYGDKSFTLESSAKFLTTKKDTGEYKTFYYPDGSGAGETPHPAGGAPEHLIVAVISVPLPPLRTSSRR